MGASLSLIGIPSVFSFVFPKRTPLMLLWLVMLYYVLFIGCRYEVRADWFGYLNLVDAISWSSLDDVLTKSEPAFGLRWRLAMLDSNRLFAAAEDCCPANDLAANV
jgi:hypothetical protein